MIRRGQALVDPEAAGQLVGCGQVVERLNTAGQFTKHRSMGTALAVHRQAAFLIIHTPGEVAAGMPPRGVALEVATAKFHAGLP